MRYHTTLYYTIYIYIYMCTVLYHIVLYILFYDTSIHTYIHAHTHTYIYIYISSVSQLFVLTHACGLVPPHHRRLCAGGRAGHRQVAHRHPWDFSWGARPGAGDSSEGWEKAGKIGRRSRKCLFLMGMYSESPNFLVLICEVILLFGCTHDFRVTVARSCQAGNLSCHLSRQDFVRMTTPTFRSSGWLKELGRDGLVPTVVHPIWYPLAICSGGWTSPAIEVHPMTSNSRNQLMWLINL